jgi:L,D-peptidoglycan transpeptidase YkuD (ErfK/YbiS/YcfS/YnhG family)
MAYTLRWQRHPRRHEVQQRGGRSREDETRFNRIWMGAVAGLLLLTVAAVSCTVLKPYSNAKTATTLEAQTPAPAPAPVKATAETTVKPEPKPEPKPAAAEKPKTTAAPAPAPAPAPEPAATIPEQMTRMLPGSSQIIVVTGDKLGSNTGTVYVFNKEGAHWVEKLKTTTRMGTNGLTDGATRHSGNRTTPTGIWTIGKFLFGKAAQPPAGTMMPYRQITSNAYWSGVRDSTYNTWVDHQVSGEHLIDAANLQYEFVLDSAYNEPPNERVMGRGTAIFLHVEDPPSYHNGFTAGCVGIPREDMIRVFKLIDPGKNPSFAIGTLAKGTPTSIYSY